MSIFDPIYREKNLGGQITRTLFNIGQAVRNIFWDKSKLEHLTPAQIKTLLFINYTRKDAITVGNVAKYLSCTPATASGIIDSLEKKKLILRSRDLEDRRKVHLSLTSSGFETVSLVEDIGEELEEIVSEFDDQEKATLEKLLLRITEKLTDKGLIFTSNICTDCCHFSRDMYIGEPKPHYCEHLHILLSEDDICKECPHYKKH
ncbi:MAG: MarR family transcriptional regulator [Deltaproteobacteria bacterium]|nr:MarR family transcriptional regulator [Deltaproteobacteria bacterium]MCK5710853.1 MarR family transcriptional regulator [Deltaproteobacteria bacterium]